MVTFTLQKSRFYAHYGSQLNDKHRKAVDKIFAAGPDGFTGGMTARKYASINRVSRATATRDLQYLARIGALTQTGAGRSTHYLVAV
ncbi:MAG: hypothetical protein WBA17_00280 [Saprospiraceae bacterium]